MAQCPGAACACSRCIDAHAPPQDLVAHGGEMQRQEQQRERDRHDQERHREVGMNRRPVEPQHRRRLMQRVPPFDRIFDDRNIDGADQCQDRDRARGARGILDGAPERDHAEIHQEQHEDRGQPRVPHPIGAPHRPAPERAGDQADQREGGADRRGGLGGDVGERMPPHQRAERGDAHHRPAEHREPGRRHVDEHDLDRRALLIIVGRSQRPGSARRRTRAAVTPISHGNARSTKDRNRDGLARSIRGIGRLSVSRARCSPMRQACAKAVNTDSDECGLIDHWLIPGHGAGPAPRQTARSPG